MPDTSVNMFRNGGASNGMYKYREKSKKFVQEKILEKLDEEVIQREISAEMFERDYTLIESEISEYRAKHRG